MATPSTAKTDRADVPPVGRGLRPIATLLFLIVGAAGLYAIYLMGQLDDVRRHNLHRLDLAAQAMTALLDNSRTTIASLSGDPAYACTFFQRQVRLELVEPACTTFGSLTLEPGNMVLVRAGSNVEIVQPDVQPGTSLRIRVRLDVIIDQIPFGDAFDQLMIVAPSGGLIGTGIRPRRSSPMEPPGVDVEAASSPIRIIDLGNIAFATAAEGAAADFASLEQATFVRRIALAGTT